MASEATAKLKPATTLPAHATVRKPNRVDNDDTKGPVHIFLSGTRVTFLVTLVQITRHRQVYSYIYLYIAKDTLLDKLWYP